MSALTFKLEMLCEKYGLLAARVRSAMLSMFLHCCGKDTILHWGCKVYRKGFVSLGARCQILQGAVLDARKASQEKVRISLGDDVAIGRDSFIIAHGGSVRIGPNVHIGPRCHLQGPSLSIGRDSMLGPGVMVFSSNHVYLQTNIPIRDQGESSLGVSIGDNVWIGAGAIIVDGVRVASHSVLAAGAVVTKDVSAYTVVAGSPAKVVKKISG